MRCWPSCRREGAERGAAVGRLDSSPHEPHSGPWSSPGPASGDGDAHQGAGKHETAWRIKAPNPFPSYDEHSAKQSVTAHEQHGYLVGIVTKVLDRAERIEKRSGLLLAPVAAMEIFAKRGREALTLDIFDGHWLGEARFGRIVARLAQRRDAEGLPQESLDVWGFLQAAVATPIASERSAAMGCLMDIANMPERHCVQACSDMMLRMERRAGGALRQSSEQTRV